MATATATVASGSVWTRLGAKFSTWGSAIAHGIKKMAAKPVSLIASGAKWLWNTTAVSWTVAKVKWAAVGVGGLLKGPLGWIVGTIAALIFAPKAVAIMLVIVLLLGVVTVGLLIWLIRAMKKDPAFRGVWSEVAEETVTKTTVSDGDVKVDVTVNTPKEDIVDAVLVEEAATKAAHEVIDEVLEEQGVAETSPAGSKTKPGYGDLVTVIENEVLDPDETLVDRYNHLDERFSQANGMGDSQLISELMGRMHLIEVRMQSTGRATKLKQDASVNEANKEAKILALGMRQPADFEWDFNAMYWATKHEDKRLKDIALLKAKQVGAAA